MKETQDPSSPGTLGDPVADEVEKLRQMVHDAQNERVLARIAAAQQGQPLAHNKLSENPANRFLSGLDSNDMMRLEDAIDYSKKPFGDVAHNLKMMIAKMWNFICSLE